MSKQDWNESIWGINYPILILLSLRLILPIPKLTGLKDPSKNAFCSTTKNIYKGYTMWESTAFYPFPTLGTAEILIKERAMDEQGHLLDLLWVI